MGDDSSSFKPVVDYLKVIVETIVEGLLLLNFSASINCSIRIKTIQFFK